MSSSSLTSLTDSSSFTSSDSDSEALVEKEDDAKTEANTEPCKEEAKSSIHHDPPLKDEAKEDPFELHHSNNSHGQKTNLLNSDFLDPSSSDSQESDVSSNSSNTSTTHIKKSSSSGSTSSSRIEDENVDDLKSNSTNDDAQSQTPFKPPIDVASRRGKQLSTSADKAIQFPSRPKTAKPGKYRNRRERTTNLLFPPSTTSSGAEEKKQKKRKEMKQKKKRDSSSTASFSSVTTFDDVSSSTTEENASRRLADYHNVKARELLLHRYLDSHLAKQLDQQMSYLDRSSPSRIPTKGREQKRMGITSRKKRNNLNRNKRSPYGSSAAILTAYSAKSRDSDVKRNIELLVAELARYQSLNERSSQLIATRKPQLFDQRPPRPKSSRMMKANIYSDSSSSDSSASSSYESSESSKKEQKHTIPHEKVSRHIKVVIPSDTGSEKHQSDAEVKRSSRKSILKSKNSSRDSIPKHVFVTEQSEMKESKKEQRRSTRRQRNYYLSTLLSNLGDSDYLMADNHGIFHRVTLSPAPIQQRPVPRRRLTAPSRPKRKPMKTTKTGNSKSGMAQQSEKKESVTQEGKNRTSETAKDEVSDNENKDKESQSRPIHSPRIQPGNGPIKCNWDPKKSNQRKQEPKFSDHQLKNSDNPEILDWLARKNALAQKNRIYKFREHRTKRNILMLQQNEKEDKREHALVEYEKWKKNKNREILLRRRKEALEATGEQSEQARPHTASPPRPPRNVRTKDQTVTAYSDLRSHAVIPQPPAEPLKSGLSQNGARRRPKSAPTKVSFGTPVATHAMKDQRFVPVKIDFGSRDVTMVEQKEKYDVTNLSAREPIMQNGSETSNNFMKNLLEATAPKSVFDVPLPGSSPKTKIEPASEGVTSLSQSENKMKPKVLDRDHYNNWMKSNGTSSLYQIKLDRKKKKSNSSNRPLPKHDPLMNDLLPDLAKRRIQKILDQKKRVDSGLRKNQPESEAQNPAKKDKNQSRNSAKRWRLRDDIDMEKPKQDRPNTDKDNDKISLRNGRPMFSFKRKKSKSIFEKGSPAVK